MSESLTLQPLEALKDRAVRLVEQKSDTLGVCCSLEDVCGETWQGCR